MPDNPTEQPTTPAYPPEPTHIAAGSRAAPATVGMPAGRPSDPWPHTGPTELAGPVPSAGGGWRRRFWPLVLSGTAVLAVTAFLVVFLTVDGSSGPLEFQAFEPARVIELGDEETQPGIARLDGDRIFLAATRADSAVVFGTQVSGDGDRWERAVPELSEVTGMAAYDEVLAVFGEHADGEYDHHLVAMLDAGDGQPLWQREYSGDNQDWLLADGQVTLADDTDGVLRGLDPRTGAERWTVPYPEEGAAIRPVITEDDLAGRSRTGRQYDAPRHGDRVVMLGDDGSAQVIDIDDGQTAGNPGANVANPGDPTYAYEDDFFVASERDGRLYRFDLADLSVPPDVIYSPQDPAARITYLVPCGADRICLREEAAETVSVVAVSTAGGDGWSHTVEAGPELLLPVGEHLVVADDTGTSVVFDPEGNPVETLPGAPVRINDANILLAVPDNPYGYGTMSVTGLPIGAKRVELGQVADVAGEGCAFDDEVLICPTSTGAGIWQFAAT